jgi:hypothetical protein
MVRARQSRRTGGVRPFPNRPDELLVTLVQESYNHSVHPPVIVGPVGRINEECPTAVSFTHSRESAPALAEGGRNGPSHRV